MIEDTDRLDFDKTLLPENRWEGDLKDGEFEVEKIVDVRSGRKTHPPTISSTLEELFWVDEADLNCGALLERFERNRVSRNRFEVMQSHEEEPRDYKIMMKAVNLYKGVIWEVKGLHAQ